MLSPRPAKRSRNEPTWGSVRDQRSGERRTTSSGSASAQPSAPDEPAHRRAPARPRTVGDQRGPPRAAPGENGCARGSMAPRLVPIARSARLWIVRAARRSLKRSVLLAHGLDLRPHRLIGEAAKRQPERRVFLFNRSDNCFGRTNRIAGLRAADALNLSAARRPP